MAELLASGSKKISQLTSVSGISGSTSMPIVMGGNTVQVSHTDFLNSTLLTQANTFSENNTFSGNNTFTQTQTVSTNGAVTTFNGNFIDLFVDSGNFDTFKVEVIDGDGLKMQDYNFPLNTINSFLEVGTNSGPISLFRDTAINGDLQVNGNLIATQYIVSSSVSYITSSFSSGSTIFGDTVDDRHQFTGSVLVNGNVNAQSFTGSLSFTNLTNRPTLVSSSQQVISLLPAGTVSGSSQVSFTAISNRPTLFSSSIQVNADTITNFDANVLAYNNSLGVVSGSSQVSFNGIVDKPTLFSSSIQVNADTITNFDVNVLAYNNSLGVVSGSSQISFNGIVDKPTLVSGSTQVSFNGIVDKPTLVSGSTQVISLLPNGTVSGSSQVSFNGIVDKPTLVSGSSQITYSGISSIPTGIVSSSTQVLNYGIFATTGSNTFRGNQIVTGSFNVTGSLNIDNKVRVENGFSILTSVSQSLNFVDDTAAAAGGVPLGGLYRSGNFILIRLT